MSKISLLIVAAALCLLSACQEEEVVVPTSAQVTEVVVGLDPSLREGIDWNFEIAIFNDENFIIGASALAGTDQETLDQATSIKADLKVGKISVTAWHQDVDTAQKYVDALAQSYYEVRNRLEIKIEAEMIAKLVRDREELLRLVEDDSLGSQDQNLFGQDRMTYEKAKKSLEENPIQEDGILYQKEEEK